MTDSIISLDYFGSQLSYSHFAELSFPPLSVAPQKSLPEDLSNLLDSI